MHPLVRMENHARLRGLLARCHFPGCYAGRGSIQAFTQCPTQHLSTSQIKYYGQVQPTLQGMDIGNVRDPYLALLPDLKLPIQQVICHRMAMLGISRSHIFSLDFTAQVSLFHQTGYPWTGYPHTQALQVLANSWTAIALLALVMDEPNLLGNLFIFKRPFARHSIEPFVITAFAHLQYFTHLLDGKLPSVLGYELVDFPSLLEKMPTAFFKMSRSWRTSSSSRFSRASSLCSGL